MNLELNFGVGQLCKHHSPFRVKWILGHFNGFKWELRSTSISLREVQLSGRASSASSRKWMKSRPLAWASFYTISFLFPFLTTCQPWFLVLEHSIFPSICVCLCILLPLPHLFPPCLPIFPLILEVAIQ